MSSLVPSSELISKPGLVKLKYKTHKTNGKTKNVTSSPKTDSRIASSSVDISDVVCIDDDDITEEERENVENMKEEPKTKALKQRISELEKMAKSKDAECCILKTKLDLVEKEYSEKVDIVKSLESKIPKMIEEFTLFVKEKDSSHNSKEKEFGEIISDKKNEISIANDKIKELTKQLQGSTQQIKMLNQNEKKIKDVMKKKLLESNNMIRKKDKEILVLEDAMEKKNDIFRKQKAELSNKMEEVTNYQIKTEQLMKLNNELKHQYNELDKINEKYAAEIKKNEKIICEKTEEIASVKRAKVLDKEKMELEIKKLKEASISMEEKTKKLLVKRQEHIRKLQEQVKEKDAQYLALVGISNKKVQDKDAELKQMTKQLEENITETRLKDVKISENNLVIKDFEQKLLMCEIQKENGVKLIEMEAAEKTRQHKKELQKIILECNEKNDAKDQLLRNKALEHGRKISELNTKLSEKDGLISERDISIKMASSRIQELKREFDKKMEEKIISDINTQNNIRHGLLLQQQKMKNEFVEEQDVMKRKMTDEINNMKSLLTAKRRRRSNKRKQFSGTSESESERKRLKAGSPNFYSYKSFKPPVKFTCLSSPGLCSPKKLVTRRIFPAFLNQVLEEKHSTKNTSETEDNLACDDILETNDKQSSSRNTLVLHGTDYSIIAGVVEDLLFLGEAVVAEVVDDILKSIVQGNQNDS